MLTLKHYAIVDTMTVDSDSTADSNSRSQLYVIGLRAGIALVVLFGIYVAAWMGTAALLRQSANQWIDAQRQAGLRIQHGEPVFRGFPGRVILVFPDIDVSASEGWVWTAPLISVSSWPTVLNRLSINLSGTHTFSAPRFAASAMAIDTNLARLDIRLRANGEMDGADLTLTESAVSSVGDGDPIFSIQRGQFHLRSRIAEEESHTLAIETYGLRLPITPPAPFTPVVEKLAFTAETSGLTGDHTLVDTLDTWRTGGGAVEIHSLEIVWPPLTAAVTGTAALDDLLQPVGAFSARLTGFFEVVDALVAGGTIENKDASMARIVLGLLARTPPSGGPSELSVSITAQEQKLYAGPVMLMELPTIIWPDEKIIP